MSCIPPILSPSPCGAFFSFLSVSFSVSPFASLGNSTPSTPKLQLSVRLRQCHGSLAVAFLSLPPTSSLSSDFLSSAVDLNYDHLGTCAGIALAHPTPCSAVQSPIHPAILPSRLPLPLWPLRLPMRSAHPLRRRAARRAQPARSPSSNPQNSRADRSCCRISSACHRARP